MVAERVSSDCSQSARSSSESFSGEDEDNLSGCNVPCKSLGVIEPEYS